MRVLALAGSAIVLGLVGCGLVRPERHPDVLLVVLDTVRADRLHSYGYARRTSDYLDTVASSLGVLFEDCTAPAPWTWPSHASLFTGKPPHVHGARLRTDHDENGIRFEGLKVGRMREDLPTLAERFAEARYDTAAIAVNKWLSPDLGLTRGFRTVQIEEDDLDVVTAIQSLLAEDRSQPLFLFVNLMQAHSPYFDIGAPWVARHRAALTKAGAPEWMRPYLVFAEGSVGVDLATRAEGEQLPGIALFAQRRLRIPSDGMQLLSDLYDGEVAAVDQWLGKILKAWAQRGKESIVAVTSDHGEAFGEHGTIEHRGHLYPELIQVPCVLAAPGRLPTGLRVKTPVQMHELHPTLLDLAGVLELPGSLVPVIHGHAPSRPIRASLWPAANWADRIGGRFQHAWHLHREGKEALIWSSGGDKELYDVSNDPSMLHDLADERPERVAALWSQASSLVAETVEEQPIELSEAARERLRAIGYAVD